MMILLLRRDSSANPTVVVAPEKEKETPSAPVETQTATKEKTVEKMDVTTPKVIKKEETSKTTKKEETPKKKTTNQTK